MGLLTFSINVTLDGCVDHQEGIADDETHAFFTRLVDEGGATLWGRVTYEMMESFWPAVARGEVEAPPALGEWAVKLEAKPKYVVSSTRKDFPWTNSHHVTGDLRTAVQKLKDATPAGGAAVPWAARSFSTRAASPSESGGKPGRGLVRQ
jgi:dihydrofolate reductase